MADLQNLPLDEREIEQLSGLEVSGRWVGGMFGGVYRFSQLKHPLQWLGWVLFEGLAGLMFFAFTLPIGLGMVKLFPSLGTHRILFVSMGAATLVGLAAWYSYRIGRGRSLQTFLHLLDEIDQYHRVLQAVATLDQLATVRGASVQGPEWTETLQVTRDCLVTGLRLERIMREQGMFFAQLQDGVFHLEQSLLLLKTSQMQVQAEEYATTLQQSLAIGERVRQELYQFMPDG